MLAGTEVVNIFRGLDDCNGAKKVVANLHTLDISDPEMEGSAPKDLLDTVARLLGTAVGLRSFSATGMKCMAGKQS